MALSIVLVLGAGADRLSLRSPADPSPYHARVRAAAESAPLNVGQWVGEDVAVPPEARSQLHPNVIVSRRYRNALDGRQLAVLLVQCWDVRDLVPHYPPVCYPGRGLSRLSTEPFDFQAGPLSIHATEYQFESISFQTDRITVVDNFMILPDGRMCKDMTEVRKSASLNTRFFGAAQVQLVFESGESLEQRKQACGEMVAAYLPLIEAIRAGVHR